MSGSSIKCLQVVVAILCVLQFILGVVFLVMGGVGLNKSGSGAETKSAAIFLLVVGSIIVVVALFGLCGAIIKHACLLISFCIAVGITMVLSIVCVIVGFALPGTVTDATGKYFNESMTKYKSESGRRDFIDSVQLSYSCCGYFTYTEWYSMPGFQPRELPISCCSNSTGRLRTCNDFAGDGEYIFKLGCQAPMSNSMKTILQGFGIVASITAAALLVLIILAACLTDKVRKEYKPV